MGVFNFFVQNEYTGTRPIAPTPTIEPVIYPTNPPYILPPPRPQPPLRMPIPLINVAGQTRLTNGSLISPNYKQNETGWAVDAEGNAEFNSGVFRGRFEIGGTTITITTDDDIQENLNLISTQGGGTLFLQPGTYQLTADISIPSGVTLQGVSRDEVILDCDGTYAVKIAGTNVYSTGTVTINNGATTLEGVGTTWTAGMVGRYVLLDGLWYEITARTDNDTITIETYQGVNLATSAYVIADTNFTAQLNKVTVTGATGSGVVVQYSMESTLFDIVVYGCGTGIDMDYVTFPILQTTSNENGVNLNMNFVEGFKIDFSEFNFSTTGAGVIMTDTKNATFFDSSANDNTGDGINLTNCDLIAFISFDNSGNGGQGTELVSGCDGNTFSDGSFDDNTSDGLKITATSDRNTVVAMEITGNGGYGINIAASTCDNNQIIAPAFDTNSSGNINDSGTNTFVSPETSVSYIAGHAITAGNAVYISNGTIGLKAIITNSSDSGLQNMGTLGEEQIAQSVVPTTTIYIKQIKIKMQKQDTPTDDVQVQIQSDSSDAPSGTVIATSDAQDVQASAVYTFTFSTAQQLTASTKYWFVVQRTGALGDTHYYKIAYGDNFIYAPGHKESLNDGVWSEDASPDVDIYFDLYELLPSGYVGKAEADVTGRYENFIGFASETVATNASVKVKLSGEISGLSGLTVGQLYLSDTAGAVSSSAGTNSRKVGIALSTTKLIITNIW